MQVYYRDPQGDWQFLQRPPSAPQRFVSLCGQSAHVAVKARKQFSEGSQWIDGRQMFRIERLRRCDAVPDDEWGPVWTVMRTLAELHGDDAVRLVVWFDD